MCPKGQGSRSENLTNGRIIILCVFRSKKYIPALLATPWCCQPSKPGDVYLPKSSEHLLYFILVHVRAKRRGKGLRKTVFLCGFLRAFAYFAHVLLVFCATEIQEILEIYWPLVNNAIVLLIVETSVEGRVNLYSNLLLPITVLFKYDNLYFGEEKKIFQSKNCFLLFQKRIIWCKIPDKTNIDIMGRSLSYL